MISLIYLIIQC